MAWVGGPFSILDGIPYRDYMVRLPLRLLPLILALSLPAQEFEYLPGTEYDPAVPTMEKTIGHAPGERITNHRETELYLQALAAASDRVHLVRYGASWEGRSLYYLVVGSPANIARLAEIQSGLQRLADPRLLSQQDQAELVASLPSVAWLAYSVHGDELSCTDAALFLAYHLAAARNEDVARAAREHSLVIIDPLQNPDGRERFVFHFRQTLGRWPDAEPAAAEHNQPWPGGRVNHYLFDMNRDWFVQTQPETLARVREFQKWWPQVFVDLHEMGRNSSYYFAPPARPHNPEITADQHRWMLRYGKNNARWFDRFGFDYFTRENFDAFYPGYGEGWPTFHGAIGMTYEQASVRGLVVRREDDTEMHYRDSVQHHFIASLATVETAATDRERVLQSFVEYRRSAVREGQEGEVKEYILPPGRDPQRVVRLAELLTRQGIEVLHATSELVSPRTRPLDGGEETERTFPAGTFVVRLAQPAKRLAHVLLNRSFEMKEDFLAEQREKYKKRKSPDFYDLTGWCLPFLHGVECHTAATPSSGTLEPYRPGTAPAPAATAAAQVAYLVPWGGRGAMTLLAELFRAKVRVSAAGKPFTLGGRRFPAGSLIVKVAGNGDPQALHRRLAAAADSHRVEVVPTDSSWVDDGPHFGSGEVHYLEQPKIALLWDQPTSSNSAGATRWLLEQRIGYPVTVIRTRQLGAAELLRFNVLVVPSGSGSAYGRALAGAVASVKAWVRQGGTLVTLGGATQWLTEKKVGLLAASTEDRQKPDQEDGQDPGEEKAKEKAKEKEKEKSKGDEETPKAPSKPFDYDDAILPDKERPSRTTGAVLRILLDREHWLAAGYEGECAAVSITSAVFTPVKLDRGTNVGIYAQQERLLLSGFVFRDKLEQLAKKAWLIHQPHGRGHVVAFTEDPNFRGFVDGLNGMFINAVFFGPGF